MTETPDLKPRSRDVTDGLLREALQVAAPSPTTDLTQEIR